MKQLLVILGVLFVVGVAIGGVLYVAFPVPMTTYGGMGLNFLKTLSTPAGTLTIETNPAYKAPVATVPSPPLADAAWPNAASGDWPSYNRTPTSQRFSPLDQINAKNVGNLKVLCTYDLGKFTAFETGLIMVNNALIGTAEFEIFSINPATCAENWRTSLDYPGALLPANRGAAHMDGLLFRGTQDCRILAFDFKTGKQVWETTICDTKHGESVPSAPIAWNGLVYVGNAGGDFKGGKGKVYALEGKTGKIVWQFFLAPKVEGDLDKALTAERFGREFTELLAAIGAWHTYRETLAVEDIVERATRAAFLALAHGATAIRTHGDVGHGIELRSVEALLQVRDALRDLIDIQVVALTYPLTGPQGPSNRSLLREALAMGADVAGGAPHVDPDPAGHVEIVLEEAAGAGRPVDLHADENMREDSVDFVELIARVADGFPHAATASHCVSLGIQPPEVQAERAAAAAEAGVAVVSCPIANLYLQGRDQPRATPRGLTALAALLDAGVTVAGGGDNLQDCFIPVGRADPLLTAQYLVVGGQLTPSTALELVSRSARGVMGLPPIEVAVGFPADLVAIRAASPSEAVATAAQERIVFRNGEPVRRTRVTLEAAGAGAPLATG